MQQKWTPNSSYISWTFLWRILFPVMGQICRRKGQEINAKRKKCNQSWLCLKQVVSFHWILASIDFVSFYLITANRLFLLLLCPRNTAALEALTNISEESLVHFFLNSLWVLTSGFPGGSVSKESACNAGDRGSVPGLGRSPREGNGNPLQYSCLENPMDRGAWRATVYGSQELDTT